ncbi:PREDICTED: uncharacterized protein LOC109240551 [Nicotiana attenuata]|uniref:uncharacterized protein LOC109240551 n=1 Tax=Nicotiana attenuata TaxID=49451 RepID=UPI00090557FE|nr:PREDICTED: uncharacterized protein LOC109240551 [Nicotiana attenuata]
MTHAENGKMFHLTVISAKCKPVLTRPLWEFLRQKSSSCNVPWCVIGHFSVIASVEEKIGGIRYQMSKSIEFLSMIEDCGLVDLGFYRPKYTWSNGRGQCSIVWKRLDRGLANDQCLEMFPATTVSHLALTGSDHNPLLLELHIRQDNGKKYFKFLNCWVDNKGFLPLVSEVWNRQAKEFEQKVKYAEIIWAQTNEDSDRLALNELKAQYVRYLKVEQDVLKQKTKLKWFKEGDSNSRYFHSLIRGRRRKLFIHKIKNEKFYQACWEVIKEDLFNVVLAFFRGCLMPRFMTSAYFVLLLKVEFPNSLTEFRPISLSNFINKIISKVICSRLGPILPRIISANQSGFVKGRNISENIMLAQEIVHGIKKPTEGSNVVIKVYMAKAYDRVSWSFTCLMLRRMGFNEMIIDMIWRTMSNNWYSVVVNGTRCGFFQSSRGLKQVTHCPPHFIIGVELLSRMLNSLNHDQLFNGFYMEKRGPQINHLSFADDIIIFTSGKRTSLRKIMWILKNYEDTSGQLINRQKSHFMTASNALPTTIRRIQEETSFTIKDLPLTYLGCPLYTGRIRIMYFNGLISKVVGRIKGWHGKMLSYGGRATLIKHALQSLPIHLLSTVTPPKTVMKQIERLVANFFQGNWDLQKLNEVAAAHKIPKIMQIVIYFNPNLPDRPIWVPTMNGKFTCSTAWDLIRNKKPPNLTNKMIWHKKIPFQWSFCLWRALRNKLPADDRVLLFSSPTVTRCVSCSLYAHETVEHLFSNGNFARIVWNKYGGQFGAGVIIRNHHGQFIHAMGIPLGEGTNNYAETEAARLGVQWCLANGIT